MELVDATSPEQSEPTRRMWALALATIAVAAQLILIWGFEFFPSVDGSAHVHLAHSLFEALRGDSFYGSLVELNSKITPNMATQSVMLALMAIAPPFVAEKIWLSLYFISFAGAAAYTLRGINKNSLCLLPLLMFCSISFPLAFGFYNFSFSTVIFLAWFGYWWRHRQTRSIGVIVGHALFALIAYTTHVFAFIVTLFGIGMAALAAILFQVHRDRKTIGPRQGGWRQVLLSHALPPLLGSTPELVTSLHFLFGRFGSHTTAGAATLGMVKPGRLSELLTATSLAPYDSVENVAAGAFVLVIMFLLLWFLRRANNLEGALPLAACFAGFLLLYLVMPDKWIVRWMPSRFQPLVFIASLLWLATLIPASMKHSHWKVIGASGLVLLFLSVVVRFEVFARLDSYYREYASAAPYIAQNSTLIGLRLHDRLHGEPFPANLDVLIQAGSRIASIRHSVDLKNFQAQSSDHPVQFRPGVSATVPLGGDRAITALPPRIKLMAYERQTGRPIDYVLFYGFRDAVVNRKALARIDAQLGENYRLIYVSKPRGLVHLYARNSVSQLRGPRQTAEFGTHSSTLHNANDESATGQ